MEDKYIGLLLAVSSSIAIGTSFIITKKGLNDAALNSAYGAQATDNMAYMKNPIWWAGISTLANFAAYTFAPPILVTPLGALSVLIGAVLASFLLNEELGHLGRLGCALCLLGSLIIVLHAPEDKPIVNVDEILHFAMQPGFLMYCLTVLVFTLFMIYSVVPKHGRSNPLVYISICSLVGSVSVMAIKGFGVAVKLTIEGNNQFTYPSTYVFGIIVALCILVQMNYFNKALDTFSTNVVNPMYYVGFSTATIVASLILFQGFNTQDYTNILSLLAGFVVTFLGVHLLNLSRQPDPPLDHPNGQAHSHSTLAGGLMNPRLSLQGRMSLDGWNGSGDRGGMDVHMGSVNGRTGRHGRQSSIYRSQTTTLFNAFEEPEGENGGMPPSVASNLSQHRKQQSVTDLHQVREVDEWAEDAEDGEDADRRTLLKKGKTRTHPTPPSLGSSRSHSHSPVPNSSLTDVRITPRS
ncbi:magnesium transporter NIPA-domain-containing protein [Crassisporium funariophilum]|nr:magnesium transporter NIPA-domain-containing protein [Crassisporium funariophilum]